jgi:hypothetical protein
MSGCSLICGGNTSSPQTLIYQPNILKQWITCYHHQTHYDSLHNISNAVSVAPGYVSCTAVTVGRLHTPLKALT